MNRKLRIFLLAGTALAATAFANTAPAAEPTTHYVRVQLQIVQMPQSQALKLVPRLLDGRAANAAHAEIQQGIAREEFKLVDDLFTETRSGDRVVIEHREDRNFPVEFAQDDPRVGPSAKYLAPGAERIAMSYPVMNFDRLDAGASLEMEALVVADGKWIVGNLMAKMKDLAGWDRYESGRRANGPLLYYEQPIVRTRITATNLSFPAVAPQIVGVYQISGATPITELHLLTTKVRSMANAPTRPAPPPDPNSRPPAPAPVPSAPPPNHFTIEVHRFHVAQAEAVAMRAALLDPQRNEGAFAKLIEATAEGRAKLVDWQILSTISGNRAVAENIVERRYGTEPSPPHFPQQYHWSIALPVFPVSLAPPAEFDTTNTGQTLEVEPSQAWAGGVISMNCTLRITELTDFRRWTMAPDPAGQRSYFFQPTFCTRATATNLTVAAGQRKLYSFSQLPKSSLGNGQYEIVLLRAIRRD